ncbi:permease-like cell division protein FtsX [Motiliproteus sediminis]|uniref:permease-like cell division protein FtsX n=1 Tax=Motiliproteus sediminis TaxID=1468178 RepID=UPI001AEFE53B|nr:permease-like cell division protein FtsX [Motiliproteus sediminis]
MAKQPLRNSGRGSAERHKVAVGDRGRGYLAHHREVLVSSLQRLLAEPLATLMTLMVMAIALTLPSVMLVGLQDAQGLSEQWRGAGEMTLFLDAGLSEAEGQALSAQLVDNSQIASTLYLSKADALAEFKQYSGLGDTLGLLDHNPLPAVILVEPDAGYRQPQQLQQLATLLEAVDGVAEVVLDLAWVDRLRAIIAFARSLAWVLGGLLGLGMLLVVGNTIRLEIENRRDEIVVVKLVGATDAFVRRPFLYTGFWYGLGAGLLAWCLIQLILLYLGTTLSELIGLYPGSFELSGLGIAGALSMLLFAILLGVAGAWLAVVRHLAAIEPR